MLLGGVRGTPVLDQSELRRAIGYADPEYRARS
jgi:hypothetical protein